MGKRTGRTAPQSSGTRLVNHGESNALWVLVIAFVAALAVGALVALRVGVEESFPRGSALRTLTEGLTARQRAQGRIHVGGTVRLGAGGQPVCNVERQYFVSGKSGGWRTSERAISGSEAWLDAQGGGSYALLGSPAGSALRFEPPSMAVLSGAEALSMRAQFPGFSPGGRIVADCAREGDRIFVDACRVEAGVVPCAGEPMTITWGATTPQRRVDLLADGAAMHFGLGGGAMLLLLGIGWVWVRARTQVESLLAWAGGPAPPAFWKLTVFLVITDVILFVGAALNMAGSGHRGNNAEVGVYGHLVLLTSAGLLLSMGLSAWSRRGALGRAAKLMDDTKTSRLAETTAGNVELSVHVSGGAPATPGVLWTEPMALLHVYVVAWTGQGKAMASHALGPATVPASLRVRDESGEGVLDLTHADLDLDAKTLRCTPEHYLREFAPRYAMLDPKVEWAFPEATSYDVEESALAPGASVYVYGAVQRVTPAEGSDYRHAGVVAEVGGAPEKRIVVYAGTERSLRDSLASEMQYTAGLAAFALALAHALLAVDLWLIAR